MQHGCIACEHDAAYNARIKAAPLQQSREQAVELHEDRLLERTDAAFGAARDARDHIRAVWCLRVERAGRFHRLGVRQIDQVSCHRCRTDIHGKGIAIRAERRGVAALCGQAGRFNPGVFGCARMDGTAAERLRTAGEAHV